MARIRDWYKNQAHQTALSQLCVEVEKGETLACAVEASASAARPTKKRQLRVSPTRRLSGIETEESSRLSENDPPTGILEHRTSYSTDHLVLSGRNTREEDAGRKASRRRRPSKGARNEKTMRGPKLAVKLHGTLERWKERLKHAREVTFEPSTAGEDGTIPPNVESS